MQLHEIESFNQNHKWTSAVQKNCDIFIIVIKTHTNRQQQNTVQYNTLCTPAVYNCKQRFWLKHDRTAKTYKKSPVKAWRKKTEKYDVTAIAGDCRWAHKTRHLQPDDGTQGCLKRFSHPMCPIVWTNGTYVLRPVCFVCYVYSRGSYKHGGDLIICRLSSLGQKSICTSKWSGNIPRQELSTGGKNWAIFGLRCTVFNIWSKIYNSS